MTLSTKQEYKGMTNSETAKALSGVVISTSGVIVSNADRIEQYIRMGASLIAMISGAMVIVSVAPKLCRQIGGWCGKKKGKK